MGLAKSKVFSARITAGSTNTQVFTSPWRDRLRYVPQKMVITNENAAATLIKFFDQDLADSNNTAPARGNNTTAPLFELYVPANTTLFIEEDQLPDEFYHGGMVGYATQVPVQIHVQIRQD